MPSVFVTVFNTVCQAASGLISNCVSPTIASHRHMGAQLHLLPTCGNTEVSGLTVDTVGIWTNNYSCYFEPPIHLNMQVFEAQNLPHTKVQKYHLAINTN